MPRKCIPSKEHYFNTLSYRRYCQGDTNVKDLKRMQEILNKAMVTELTENQLFCLAEYYINGRKMKDIATVLGVNPSTVTRHIKRAKEKLIRIAEYY